MKSVKIETIDRVSERKPGEFHAVGKTSEGVEGQIPLTDVRAAVAPATAETPGYWILFGSKFGVNDSGKSVLMFLKEGESNNHRHLLKGISEAAGKYRAGEIYTPENSGFFQTLVNHFWKVRGVRVRPAAHDTDLNFGISLIIEALEDKTLEIPRETTLYRQLEQMSADDLQYTIHPLRYLLAGFSMYKPVRAGNVKVARTDYFFG